MVSHSVHFFHYASLLVGYQFSRSDQCPVVCVSMQRSCCHAVGSISHRRRGGGGDRGIGPPTFRTRGDNPPTFSVNVCLCSELKM